MLRSLVFVMAVTLTAAVAQESATATPAATPTATGVRGVVRDPDGAVAPRAAVVLRDAAGLAKIAVSGADGSYAFRNLQPGTYSLSAWAPRFASERYDEVVVEAGRIAVRDVRLTPATSPAPNTLPMEIPICTSLPNGPAVIYDASGWRIRMHPGDAPLPAVEGEASKKDK